MGLEEVLRPGVGAAVDLNLGHLLRIHMEDFTVDLRIRLLLKVSYKDVFESISLLA